MREANNLDKTIDRNRTEGQKEEKALSSTERKLEKVDEIFDELLETVKDAPEAKKIALQTIIEQMQSIAEQMKHVRDMRNLQEIKKEMLANWEELIKLTRNNPVLLDKIKQWGDKFIEDKIIFYELIEDIKEELINTAQEIQDVYSELEIKMGFLVGRVASISYDTLDKLNEVGILEPGNKFRNGLTDYLAGLNSLSTGYNPEDIPTERVQEFLGKLGRVLMEISKYAGGHIKGHGEDKEITDAMFELGEIKKTLARKIMEANKKFRFIKKIRNTHFLKTYNKQ